MEKPIVVLTDFQKFGCFWIEKLFGKPTVHAAWTEDIQKAATFVRLLLKPDLIQEDNKNCLPMFDRRALIEPLHKIEEESDVGNLNDFIDELTPLELEAHKMNKRLQWLHNFVLSAYQKLLPHRAVVHDGILDCVY